MKKLGYLLFVFFSMVIVTSCGKDETNDPITKTSGELYPEYVGTWETISPVHTFDAYDDGIKYYEFFYIFEIQNVKAKVIIKSLTYHVSKEYSALNGLMPEIEYITEDEWGNWDISIDYFSFYYTENHDMVGNIYRFVTLPKNGYMEITDFAHEHGGHTYIYSLKKK